MILQYAALLISILVSLTVNQCESTGYQALYVSTEGNDGWSGMRNSPNADSTDGPLATLHEAIQRLKSQNLDSTTKTVFIIYLREGDYLLNQPLVLDSLVSGQEDKPIIIQNYNDEKVSLIGGQKIYGFQPVKDSTILNRVPEVTRSFLYSVSLKDLGISNYGEISPGGFPRPTYPTPLELFYNDQPMQLARWPNQGWTYIDQAQSTKDHFFYTGNQPKRWVHSENAWLHGFWARNWADSFVKVKRIDTVEQKIESYKPHGTYGYSPKGRWYALNTLEEIDQPGEWFLHSDSGILYFWPPGPVEGQKVYVSLTDQPLVILENASHVVLKGITFSIARGDGMIIKGGNSNLIVQSIFRNIGNTALKVEGGKRHQIIGCDFYFLGEGGIVLEGGDRLTLVPGGHSVSNCHFHHFNRWVKSSRPAIRVSGVGHRITHNLIHDAPHTGIHLYGNNHLVSNNEIFRVGLETGDVGAFYMGRDLSMQGNIIQYNYFHHLRSRYKYGVKAIYLDDFASGTQINNNVFYEVQQGVLINGGSDNFISGNFFIRAQEGIVIAHRAESSYRGVEKTIRQRLDNVNFQSSAWQKQYPNLTKIAEGSPEVPKFNSVIQNKSIDSKMLVIRKGDKANQKIQGNSGIPSESVKNLFSTNGALSLPTVRTLMNIDTIGIYQDSLRASWPNLDSLRTNY